MFCSNLLVSPEQISGQNNKLMSNFPDETVNISLLVLLDVCTNTILSLKSKYNLKETWENKGKNAVLQKYCRVQDYIFLIKHQN